MHKNEPISRRYFGKTQFDTEANDNLEIAHSPCHLEGMVSDDNNDLLVRSFDIHGIPQPDESQHFDGRPRAVWLLDYISPLLQEFPPLKYSRAYYNHSTDPSKN